MRHPSSSERSGVSSLEHATAMTTEAKAHDSAQRNLHGTKEYLASRAA